MRTIIAFKMQDKAFFIYGFVKNERVNITLKEEQGLKGIHLTDPPLPKRLRAAACPRHPGIPILGADYLIIKSPVSQNRWTEHGC